MHFTNQLSGYLSSSPLVCNARPPFVSLFFSVEKDESVLRSYLSELQSIKSHLQEAEQKLMIGMQTPPPSVLSGEGAGAAVHIAEQEVSNNRFNSAIFWLRNYASFLFPTHSFGFIPRYECQWILNDKWDDWCHNTVVLIVQKLQQHLKNLQSDLGDVSRRCVSFLEEKPSSSSVPVLRSELNLAVEKIERLNSLSSVYLHKSVHIQTPTFLILTHPPYQSTHCPAVSVRLKTVDVLMRSLQAAESQVKKYEGRLSEEDIVPADTTAIQALREQIRVSHTDIKCSPFGSLFSGTLSHVHNCNSLYMYLSVSLFICRVFKMILEELISLYWSVVQSP